MTSKAKILTRNSTLQTSIFFVNIVISFLLMPFIIHSLGDQMYGLWIVVGSLLGYYWIFDLGIATSIERHISQAIGKKKPEDINIILNTCVFIYTIAGLVILLLSFAMAAIGPLFLKNIADISVFHKVVIIMGFSFALNFPMRVFTGLLRAFLRHDLITLVGFGSLFVRTALIVYVLKSGFGIVGLATIALVIDISGRLILAFLAKKVHPTLKISYKLIEKTRIKSLMHYGGFIFLSQVARQLRFNIDNLVIAIFLGLSPVTMYSIAARLVMYFIKFLTNSLSMFMPLFSQYEGAGDFSSIKEKFIFLTKMNGYICSFIGSCLLIFGRDFIERWMGPQYSNSYTILVILSVSIMISLMHRVILELLKGISKYKFCSILDIIEGIANLVLSIILVRRIGLIGIAYGTAIPMMTTHLFIFPRYACHQLGLNTGLYYRECFFKIILRSLVAIGIPYLLYRPFIRASYASIFSLALLQAVIFAVAIFFFGFSKSEEDLLKKAFKKYKPA